MPIQPITPNPLANHGQLSNRDGCNFTHLPLAPTTNQQLGRSCRSSTHATEVPSVSCHANACQQSKSYQGLGSHALTTTMMDGS